MCRCRPVVVRQVQRRHAGTVPRRSPALVHRHCPPGGLCLRLAATARPAAAPSCPSIVISGQDEHDDQADRPRTERLELPLSSRQAAHGGDQQRSRRSETGMRTFQPSAINWS